MQKNNFYYYAYCAEGAFFFTYNFYCYLGVLINKKRMMPTHIVVSLISNAQLNSFLFYAFLIVFESLYK
jgi:hypothetical protein